MAMKTMLHFRAAAAALAVLAAAAPARAQQPLTLEQAIARAQQHGHQAAAARAVREAARYRGSAFNDRLLPQLSLAGTLPDYNRSIIPVLQPDGSTLFRAQQQTNSTLSMRLTQKLPITGGDLFVTSSLARFRLSGQSSLETWSSTPVSIGLRQDILRPNTSGWDRREQNVRSERDERAYREAMEDVALRVTDLFFQAYAAQVALNNALSNAGINDTLYRLNTGRYQVGRIGENDLLQSQLALLRARTSAEGARLEAARTMAALRLALNMPAAESLAITVGVATPGYDADTAIAVEQALRNRAAMSDVDLQRVQADRRVTEARLANGIGATVQATYGFNATAPRAADAYQNLLEARQFSLSVSVPLWQWGAHGESVRAAQADRDQVTATTEAATEQLALDARFAALELTQSRRNVALLATADSVAGARFQVAYNRYVIGRITMDNLYIAQAEKDQALQQFVDGLRRFWLAHYTLRRLTLFDFVEGHPIR